MDTATQAACRIHLESRLEIRDVDAVYPLFLAAFDRTGEIIVEVSSLEAIDTAGMQLLLALRREAADRGVVVQFAGHSAALSESLAAVGLTEHVLRGGA